MTAEWARLGALMLPVFTRSQPKMIECNTSVMVTINTLSAGWYGGEKRLVGKSRNWR